jgi:DNA (cytosine-5)-methyltransferase 1
MSIEFGSVCSGIEAASVAWHPLGWQAAWLAEIEPYPSKVLAHRYPDTPNLGDMTQLAERIVLGELPGPDVFCGGTPCQAFSVAGLRNSLDDARGNLSLTFCEIANAIDINRAHDGKQPCVIFWENVPGVLSTKDNAFGCFLAGLAGEDDALVAPGGKWTNAGYVLGPQRAVAWRVLDAQYFGVAQRRRRVFVVASARDGFDPAAVLFEFDGVRRDSAPSREKGQEITPTIRAGAANGGAGHGARSGDSKDELIVPVAGTLTASFGRLLGQAGQDADHGHSHLVPSVAHSLRGEGFDASEDGTGRGTPLVPVIAGAICKESFSGGAGGRPEGAAAGHFLPVAFPANLSGTQCASAEDVAPSNQAGKIYEEYTVGLDRNSPPPALLTAMQVRRLIPEECEALQGFPRGYTDIRPKGKATADGPRYKALGNSWAVPNVRWIGWRIMAELNKDLA